MAQTRLPYIFTGVRIGASCRPNWEGILYPNTVITSVLTFSATTIAPVYPDRDIWLIVGGLVLTAAAIITLVLLMLVLKEPLLQDHHQDHSGTADTDPPATG